MGIPEKYLPGTIFYGDETSSYNSKGGEMYDEIKPVKSLTLPHIVYMIKHTVSKLLERIGTIARALHSGNELMV